MFLHYVLNTNIRRGYTHKYYVLLTGSSPSLLFPLGLLPYDLVYFIILIVRWE